MLIFYAIPVAIDLRRKQTDALHKWKEKNNKSNRIYSFRLTDHLLFRLLRFFSLSSLYNFILVSYRTNSFIIVRKKSIRNIEELAVVCALWLINKKRRTQQKSKTEKFEFVVHRRTVCARARSNLPADVYAVTGVPVFAALCLSLSRR